MIETVAMRRVPMDPLGLMTRVAISRLARFLY
jgi:hypothetical protein